MFIYNLEDIAKKLKIDFDGITKQIVHNGVKGSAREDLLKDKAKNCNDFEYKIIDNTNHFYIGKENEIGNTIIDWIKKRF